MDKKRKTYCRGFKAGVEYMRRIDRMHEQIKITRVEPKPEPEPDAETETETETNVVQLRVTLPRDPELAEYIKAMLDLVRKPGPPPHQ